MASDRTSVGAALAERALAKLATAAGEHADELLVLGGLTPPLLVRNAPVPHLGTTDIDILVEVALPYEEDDEGTDYAWLERALHDSGFSPHGSGVTWVTNVGATVTIDLVCDRRGTPPGTTLTIRGCREAAGFNLRGPRAARCDAVRRALAVPGTDETVEVSFAGLGGFLLAKASAAVARQEEKDWYDFFYVAIHNDAGGPRAAAEAMRSGACADFATEFADAVVAVVRWATDGERPAAVAYANGMVRVGDDTDAETLVEDAATAAFAIAKTLGIAINR